MTLHRQLIYSIAVIISVTTQGHIFHPLGLGSEKCGLNYNGYFQPQIHVEGDILYACTNQGLYSKDLSDEGSTWQLVGFEGLPLQDYARKGDSILVLRYNENESYLLLSNDGGQTYEDITPEMFCKAKQNVYLSLVQHPTDSNTLLASSWGNGGIFQSRDFGQTWESLFNDSPEYIGYHPLTPEIIYESGSNIYGQPEINISYDAGQTWQDCSPYYPGYNNWNDVFRVAFHPTNSNRWVVGGWGCVYISDDNGHTWNTQNIRIDGYKLASPLRLSLFDDKNNDIVYTAGFASGEIHVMCSMDGGTTWNDYVGPITVTDEGDLLARVTDEDGKVIGQSTKTVTNIVQAPVILKEGVAINAEMKRLAGNTSNNIAYSTVDTAVKAFRHAETKPDISSITYSDIRSSGDFPVYMWFDNGTIYWWSEAETVKTQNSKDMFAFLKGITDADLRGLDFTTVQKFTRMFAECALLENVYLENAVPSDLEATFANCTSIETIDVSTWNTLNCVNMFNMFSGCSKLKSANLSNFDTSNTAIMSYMFLNCSSLEEVNLSNFNTSKTTRLSGIFSACSKLTVVDISSFNTSNVTNMSMLFWGCTSLQTIYVGSEFDTTKVTDGSDMFTNCGNLVGGAGTTYSSNHKGLDYANIDDPANGNPGYLTLKQ